MDSESEQDSSSGMSISLEIPTKEPGLFKHSATNDLLLFLANHRFDEYTIRELAERMEYSKGAISNTIHVLEANDLVGVKHEGPAKHVSINTGRLDIPDDPILRIPQSEYHEPVRAAVRELTHELDSLAGIILYGSVARGEADRQSDIDLWVLVTDDRMGAQRKVNEIVQYLEDQPFNESGERFDFHVDVEETMSLPQYTEDINRIISSGITIHSTENFEKAQTIINEMLEDDGYE